MLLKVDMPLREITNTLVGESTTSEAVFRQVTDWLQDLDPSDLPPGHAVLAAAWLRKVVALNHIRMGRQWSSDRHFSMYMMDTSFIDQPHGAWTRIEEFIDVVEADGELATSLTGLGYRDPVLRVFFVPNSEYILACAEYIRETLADQLRRRITACLSRVDLAEKHQPDLVGDGFCIADHVVCEIEKPSWRFTTSTKAKDIAGFIERVRTTAAADYSVVLRSSSLDHLDDLLLELALQ